MLTCARLFTSCVWCRKDFTNPAAANYFVTSVVASLSDPAVDGTFTDDVGGLPQEHETVMKKINMDQPQLKALQAATAATHTKLVSALIAAGKYNWQAFGGGDGTGPGTSALHAGRSPQGGAPRRPLFTGWGG